MALIRHAHAPSARHRSLVEPVIWIMIVLLFALTVLAALNLWEKVSS